MDAAAASGDERRRRARSFGAGAPEYDRGRPGYPREAVRFCLPDGARRALDLGAGTGKLTRGLLELGLEVVAVEPLEEMRARIPAAAEALAGTAEDVPLPDGAVDAVFVGQAFHWFHRERSLAEIARVLRPGGTVGLLWNVVDTTEPWAAEIAELMRASSHLVDAEPPYAAAPGLTDPEHRSFRHAQLVDVDELVANVASRSLVLLMAAEERAAVLERARATAPADRFTLPHVCHAWRGRRI